MTDDEAVPELRKGTPKKIITIAVIVVVVLGTLVGGGLWMLARSKKTAKARAARTFAAFRACVLGREPLRDGEQPSHRIRAIERARDHARPRAGWDGGARDEAAWPRRCAYLALEVRDQLRKAGVDKQSPERELEVTLNRQSEKLALGAIPDDIDATFRIAAETSLPAATAPAETQAAPAGVHAELTAKDLKVIDRYLRLQKSQREADGTVQVLFERDAGDGRKRVLCQVPAESGVHCRGMSPLLPTGGRPRILHDPRPEPLFLELWDLGEGSGVYSADNGALLWKNPAWQAELSTMGRPMAIEGGFVAFGRHSATRYEVARWKAGQLTTVPLSLPAAPEWILQLGPQIAWVTNVGDVPHLFARRVIDSDAVLGPVKDVGALPARGLLPREACRAGDELVLAMDPSDDVPDDLTTISFAKGDDWSAPVVVSGSVARDSRSDCSAGVAVLTSRDAPVFIQQRCERAKCTESRAVVELPDAPWYADVAGKLLVVWNDGPAIWMRMAEMSAIETAPDVLVIDDRAHGGIDGDVDGLYVQGDHALLLIEDHDQDETHFLRVAGDGRVSVVGKR